MMKLRQIGWASAIACMLAVPAMAQTLQTSPAQPSNALNQPGKATPMTRTPSTATTAGTMASAPVNINTATAAQLDKLPGIGKVRAGKIIKNRPYKSTEELQSKKVIPQSVYNKIKNQIVATSG